ncbi:aminotransferase class I/II-fold pyridoxal phosphate-dependent enzyme [Spartinivicinus poritis]|uniref:Pyridoxal phosphate-dependent aminotransferase family protein n=1 Tax=Spartinivicinus poritis TaxID=2994640 RepID=A0ABT5U580_9GAMM|nr:pyridoxal phosphate-dependent aminotransferase family protein [Spartinivicinus sp. A2-2]MDE1461511.1 pyridoxal phosphate-dependent aminotransferase family protein [Spartinivicinus sp. A2-2]
MQDLICEKYVVNTISLHTGYEKSVLELNAELEAKLGIDSITLHGILTEIDKTLGSNSISNIHNCVVISDIIDNIENFSDKIPKQFSTDIDDNESKVSKAIAFDNKSNNNDWSKIFKDRFNLTLNNDDNLCNKLAPELYDELLAYVKNIVKGNSVISINDCNSLSDIATFIELVVGKPDQSALALDTSNLTMKDFHEYKNPDLFAKAYRFRDFYHSRTADGSYWYGMPMLSRSTGRAVIYDEVRKEKRQFIMMASNNYLGLANHPKVIEAITSAVKKYGATHTGSRIIGGTNHLHKELEQRLASFKGTDDAIVFPSGYSANVGTISALVRKYDAIIVDKFNHMSIMDGAKLSGGAVKIYRHNDMAHLETVLRDHCNDVEGKLIVIDGVFSMHGDVCDLPSIVRLAKQYNAKVMVDDAHSTGVLGKTGSGTAEHFGLKGQVDLELGTFSKTLSGVGGFVCGRSEVIEYLRFFANAYVFAATIPAHVAAGLIASLDVMQTEPERLQQLWNNVNYFKTELIKLGFDTEHSESAVIPIVIKDHKLALEFGKKVRDKGVYCQTVVYPGVSVGDERLRISISSEHSDVDLNQALDVFTTAGRSLGIIN